MVDKINNRTNLGKILAYIKKWRNWALTFLIILIVVDISCIAFWPDKADGEAPILEQVRSSFVPILIVLLGAVGLLFPAYRVLQGIVDFFDKNVAEDIASLMSEQRDKLDTLLKDQQQLLAPQALNVILDTIDHRDAVKLLPTLQTKIYGAHCASPKGLYSHLEQKFFRFLEPSGQHFSNYNKSIFLKDSTDGKLSYCEFTTYSIHMISLDKDYDKPEGKAKEFEFIEYTATNEFDTKFTLQEYIENSVFSISIRKEEDQSLVKIFCLKELEVADDGLSAMFIAPDNDFIEKINPHEPHAKLYTVKDHGTSRTLRLEMNLKYKTTSAHLFVRTDESNIIEDDNYRFTFSKPSCECSVTVTLPDRYRFRYAKVSPDIHWETSKEETLDDYMPSVFKAHTREWVLPGLVFACAWEEVKSQPSAS